MIFTFIITIYALFNSTHFHFNDLSHLQDAATVMKPQVAVYLNISHRLLEVTPCNTFPLIHTGAW